MNRFRYLLLRLAKSKLNIILALLFLAVFIQALLAPGLFSYQREGVILTDTPVRTEERGYGRFQFQAGGDQDLLLPKYDQAVYLQDLNRYISWLRSEIAEAEQEGGDEWLLYLKDQLRIHTDKLRRVSGASAQTYYLMHYMVPSMMTADSVSSHQLLPSHRNEPEWMTDLLRFLAESLSSPSAQTRAMAMNIQQGLPLRQDHISASTLSLNLRATGKTLLLLVPFLAFLVLFSRPDRNLRQRNPSLLLEKTLAVFLYSGTALLLSFGVLYLFLSLSHGNPEGPMHIIPAWGGDDPEAIRTFNQHLLSLAGMDLLFLLFVSLLLTALWSVFRDPWAAGALALGGMLLPSLVTLPHVALDRFFTPFHYLNWDVSTKTPGLQPTLFNEPYTADLIAKPVEVLSVLLTGCLLLILITWISVGVRQKIRLKVQLRSRAAT